MHRKYLASLVRERPGGHVIGHVRGYNDTHVLVDIEHVNAKDGKSELVTNQNRPVEAFMKDYGLS